MCTSIRTEHKHTETKQNKKQDQAHGTPWHTAHSARITEPTNLREAINDHIVKRHTETPKYKSA